MREVARISFVGALVACAGALAAAVPAPASAQGSYSPYNESPAAALARYVRALASDPKDFNSLIGAGRAALELGDPQAAAGFFARADDVNPRSPLPQAGMGAVSVATGDAKAAMPYFNRAQQLGASQTVLGCDRGLAYDLLGQQAKAQADYRAALSGADADEARRRLALSLAISGDKTGALAALAPLSAKGDAAVPRVRAFVLALTGDSTAAMAAIDTAMPGSRASVAPFLQRLPVLAAGGKAAAVNLGIFPDSGDSTYAYASAARAVVSGVPAAQAASTDRLAGIDALLRQSSSASTPQQSSLQQRALALPQAQPVSQPVRVSYSAPPRASSTEPRVWLQLASGRNASALTNQFERLKSENRELFKDIPGYVAENSDRVRLIIGPFRGPTDAEIFADDLHSIGVDAFRWSSSGTDRIVPLTTE
jgi:Flp pilus assembly protein TadD